MKAIASVSLDGMFVVKNLKVMDGKKGLFVSMPQESYSGRDGQTKYSNTFFALTNTAKMELQKVVLDAYQQHLDPRYVSQQSSEARASRRNASTSRNIIPPSNTPNRNTRNPRTPIGSTTAMKVCSLWIWVACDPLSANSISPTCLCLSSRGLIFYRKG